MGKLKKKTKKLYGPVLVMLFLTLLICVASFVLSLLGVEGYKTSINNGVLESSLITVNNIFSFKGLKYVVGHVVSNFQKFEPLVLLIISLIGMSICEKSGFFKALFSPLKKVKIGIIIYFTLFLGIVFGVIGDYNFIFLLPLSGIVYKYIGKNSVFGILVMFLGITLGHGAGLIFNYNDYLMGNLSQMAANLDVDKTYEFNLLSNIYIMVVSTFIITFIGTLIIERFLMYKFTIKEKIEDQEDEELIISKKAKRWSLIVGLIFCLLTIYTLLPIKLPGAGILLANDSTRYMEKLFGTSAPFKQGIVVFITLLFVLCGWVYGKMSKNIKDGHEFSVGLSKNFEYLGYMFVLMFFYCQMISILEWTNIGEIICANLVDWIGSLKFSGIPLISTFFVIVIIVSLLMPNTLEKWEFMSPTIIPLFMRSNITPGFTQFIFKVADGIGKSITPMFAYFIVMLAFLEKYNNDKKVQISIFGTIKQILPTVLLMTGLWILIIVLWYIIGIPIGVGVISTL